MSDDYNSLIPSDGSGDPRPTPVKPQPKQENAMNGKPFVKSRTFWVNALTTIVGMVAVFAGSEVIQDQPAIAGYAASAIGIINIVLRFMTRGPVTLK